MYIYKYIYYSIKLSLYSLMKSCIHDAITVQCVFNMCVLITLNDQYRYHNVILCVYVYV